MRHVVVAVRALCAVLLLSFAPATARAQVTVSVANNPGTAISRSECLRIPAGAWAAVECGDLRVWQELPATTTMTKERQPVLTYLSRHAVPGSVIAIDVTVDSAINPSTLFVKMSIPGKDTVSRSITWQSAWRGSTPRRIVLPFDAKAKSVATGVYSYTMAVYAISGGDTLSTASAQDTLVVVDRSASPFGVGWWVKGLELLSENTPDTLRKLWIAGDGSTRVYRRQNDSVWTVVPTIDRPDTLRRLNTGGTITWRRSLGNNAYVEFDNTGRHIATVNDQGHKTRFVHSTALDSIVLPVPSGSGAVPAYRFKYSTVGGSPMLDTIHAPKNPSTSHRRVITTRTNRWIKGFTGTDIVSSPALSYTVDTLTGRITGGTRSELTVTWSAGSLVTAFSTVVAGVKITSIPSWSWDGSTTAICPAEGISLVSCATTPVLSSAASTSIDGPRTAVEDTTRLWLTRFGSVQRARSALGDTTLVLRENATFPLLVTKTVAPNGFIQRVAYTSRGLIDSAITVNPFGTSVDAVTRYSWHSSFNRATMIISPTADTTEFGYDSNGLLVWEQLGTSSATRTNFALDGSNRIEYVKPPGHSDSERQRFEYDGYLGNVTKSTTPLGIMTESIGDTVGRVVKTIAPIDSNPSSMVRKLSEMTYDAWNRVLTITERLHNSPTTYPISYNFAGDTGTASGGVGNAFPRVTTELKVTKTYDLRGDPATVVQRDSAWTSTATWVSQITHRYEHDALRRKTLEGVEGGQLRYYHYTSSGELAIVMADDYLATVPDCDDIIIMCHVPSLYVYQAMLHDAAGRMTTRYTPGVDTVGVEEGTYLNYDTPFPYLGVQFPVARGGMACGSSGSPRVCIQSDSAVFTYDAAGNMLTAENTDAAIKRSYYPNGALKTDTLRIHTYSYGASNSYGIKYTYDLSGRRATMQAPTNLGHGCTPGSSSDCTQTYHYKRHFGALDTLTSYRGKTFTFGYDDQGRLTGRTAPGGVDVAWTYDLDSRVTRRQERRGVGILGSPVTAHLDSLWYDGQAKVKKAVLAGAVDPYQVVQFAYSVNGALAMSKFLKTGGSPDTATRTYRTNAIGNIIATEKDHGVVAATSDIEAATQQLRAQDRTGTGASFIDMGLRVDKNAMLDMKSDLASAPAPQYESATWYGRDGKARLFQRVGHDTTPESRFVLEEYRYDALGRRVLLRSQTRGTCTASFCKAALERFIWDGDQMLFEVRIPGDSGKTNAELDVDTSSVNAHYGRIGYVHALGIDAPVALDRAGTVIVPLENWRGFYDAGADTAGNAYTTNINWIGREEDPFMDNRQPLTVNGWSGSLLRAQQDQSGMIYRRNRYYDPTTGRFTQVDPLGLRGGVNVYGFANGDPVNFSDPFGLNACPNGWERVVSTSDGSAYCHEIGVGNVKDDNFHIDGAEKARLEALIAQMDGECAAAALSSIGASISTLGLGLGKGWGQKLAQFLLGAHLTYFTSDKKLKTDYLPGVNVGARLWDQLKTCM